MMGNFITNLSVIVPVKKILNQILNISLELHNQSSPIFFMYVTYSHERWDAGVVICLERGADLHKAQLMPLPLTVSCFSKIQIGFTFLVPAYLHSPGQRAIKQACVC